ncbi:transcriptional regulator, XRE family [Segniliparus rotundus DSM 44985]|uniref:Transcriptional regulator, XRE family n=1 Tax=Segniliparus rotundus (strain ATCC BAA-972 / CDC 1076 / CIP 108378 / DSM 44985 / JCM 13578) TaxID=640132 RepID=D6ZE09_SEGRD|nr:helix-turn-helix transcriptional regulator [Segniliparus rotundus]ADG97289.1 transcriptional regulator, XRE family [Segniliparus rotundus DSM 44985]
MSDTKTGDLAIGKRIQALRNERGLTQGQLAAEASKHGDLIYQQTIAKIETGNRGLKFEEGIAIAKALNVDPVDLLSEESIEEKLLNATLDFSVSALRDYAFRTGLTPVFMMLNDFRRAEANYLRRMTETAPCELDSVKERIDRAVTPAYKELEKDANRLLRFVRDRLASFEDVYENLYADYENSPEAKRTPDDSDQGPVAYLDYVEERYQRKKSEQDAAKAGFMLPSSGYVGKFCKTPQADDAKNDTSSNAETAEDKN